MHHTVNLGPQLVEQGFGHGRVGARGRKNELADIQRRTFHGVQQLLAATVNQIRIDFRVEAFGVLRGQVLAQYVVAGGSQAVAAHAAVVSIFVGCLSRGGQADNDIARLDVGVVHDFGALHAGDDRAVNRDGAHQVAHVGGFAARAVNFDAKAAKHFQYLFGTVNDFGDYLTGNAVLVAVDGG